MVAEHAGRVGPLAVAAATLAVGCAGAARISSDTSGGPSLAVPAHFAEGDNRRES